MKENGITKFYLDPRYLDKWMHQNDAIYTGDFCEGCLLDSFVVMTRRGYAAIYEHFVNTNMSDYYVEFQPRAAQKVWDRWYDFEDKYDAEYGEE